MRAAGTSKPKFCRPVLGTPLGWRDWPISSWRGGPRLSAPPCFSTKLRKDEGPGAALHHENAGRRIPHLPGVAALIRTPRPSARCCSGTALPTLQSFGSSPKARATVGAAVGVSRSRWSSCTGAVCCFSVPAAGHAAREADGRPKLGCPNRVGEGEACTPLSLWVPPVPASLFLLDLRNPF